MAVSGEDLSLTKGRLPPAHLKKFIWASCSVRQVFVPQLDKRKIFGRLWDIRHYQHLLPWFRLGKLPVRAG